MLIPRKVRGLLLPAGHASLIFRKGGRDFLLVPLHHLRQGLQSGAAH